MFKLLSRTKTNAPLVIERKKNTSKLFIICFHAMSEGLDGFSNPCLSCLFFGFHLSEDILSSVSDSAGGHLKRASETL